MSLKFSCSVLARWVVSVTIFLATLVSPGAFARNVAVAADHVEPLPPPSVTAKSVLVEDISTGTELFARDPDVPLPPASLTKIVSALVILERANLDDTVQIVVDDLVDADQSQVGLVAGDRLSVRDLLYGMLVPSGNDATLALSRYVGSQVLGGSATAPEAVAEFVKLMNDKAAELGATQSRFENPTGIDAGGHRMSARDIVAVTTVALQNPLFAEIVSTPSMVLRSELRPDGYPVTTTNELLQEGIANGVKTGSTPEAGGCLVTSFKVGFNTVLAVVLGSEMTETSDGAQDYSARFRDAQSLIDASNTDFVWIDPATPGAVPGLLDELGVWDVQLGNDELLPVPAADVSQIRYRLVLGPPATPDSPAGRVQFFVADRILSERAALQSS